MVCVYGVYAVCIWCVFTVSVYVWCVWLVCVWLGNVSIKEGVAMLCTASWCRQETSHTPPPCASFSFVHIGQGHVVKFGGRQPDGCTNAIHILDLLTWVSEKGHILPHILSIPSTILPSPYCYHHHHVTISLPTPYSPCHHLLTNSLFTMSPSPYHLLTAIIITHVTVSLQLLSRHCNHPVSAAIRPQDWTKVRPSECSPSARGGHASSYLANNLMITGGRGNDMQIYCDTWILDVTTMEWSQPKVSP